MERGFVLQAYSVLRPILESVDLVLLFERRTDLAEVWANGGEEALRTLKPWVVRRMLGKKSQDAIYSHFCERAHPSFISTQTLGGIAKGSATFDASHNLVVPMSIWLGRTKYQDDIVSGLGFCFILINTISGRITTSLKVQEMDFNPVVKKTLGNFEQYLDEIVAPSLFEKGLSESGVVDALKPFKEDIELFRKDVFGSTGKDDLQQV